LPPFLLAGLNSILVDNKLMSDKPPHEIMADELGALLESKGYEVEHKWQGDGCHIAITNPGAFRQVVVFSEEVFADWTPKQIFSLLERNNWQIVIGYNKGRKVLHFTNNGFAGVE